MSQTCSVCKHKQCAEIDKALLPPSKQSIRDIARQYGLKPASVDRHKKHINKSLIKAHEAAQVAHADTVLEMIRVHGERIQLLYDACDRYLRDPDDPTRYDLGPRDTDITVIYETEEGEEGGPKRIVRHKELLSAILGEKLDSWREINIKIADPRELILKTAVVLNGQLEMIAQLSGELLAAKTLVQVNTQVNVVAPISPALQSLIDEVTRGGNP